MGTTANQRTAWTAAGADTAAQNTYASVRAALKDVMSRRDVEVFLQGSYANATNVRADSDVDIVVMTKRTFAGNADRLSALSRPAWDSLPAATFTALDLRQEVHAALTAYYGGARVHGRNKCIRVDASAGYVDADVVPCIQYRWFANPSADVNREYVEGIKIEPLSGASITNFPREHISNGGTKNGLASGNYKSTVRQMKRLRTYAVDNGHLREGLAPGYLLECMTYNAPNTLFVADHSDRLVEVLLWLKHATKQNFSSCDEIHTLFGTDPGDFNVFTAQTILDGLWEAY